MSKSQCKHSLRHPTPPARCGQPHCPCRSLCRRTGADARLDHGGERYYLPELISTQPMDGQGNATSGMALFLRCGGMKRNSRKPEPTPEGHIVTPLVDLLAMLRCSEADFLANIDDLQNAGFMDVGYFDPPEDN